MDFLRELDRWPWCSCAPQPATAVPEVSGLARSAEWELAWEELNAAAHSADRAQEAQAAYVAALAWMSRRFGLVAGCLATSWDTAEELVAAAAWELALADDSRMTFRRWVRPFALGHASLTFDDGELRCVHCGDPSRPPPSLDPGAHQGAADSC